MSSRTDPRGQPLTHGEVRAEAEALHHDLALQIWEYVVGGKAPQSTALYRRHPGLLRSDTLENLRGACAQSADEPERLRALELLTAHVLDVRLRSRLSDLDDSLASLELGAVVECGAQRFPYRQAGLRLMSEEAPERRRKLRDAALPVLRELGAQQAERQRRESDCAAKANFQDRVELLACVRQWEDPGALASLADEVLQETRERYQVLLAQLVPRETGLPFESLEACDLGYALQGHRHDRHLEPARRHECWQATLEALGIRSVSPAPARLHGKEHPLKSTRAVCVPVRPPGDVRVSAPTCAGLHAFETLFHAFGEAQCYLRTRRQEFEFLCLGMAEVAQGYALLFENLVTMPGWMRRCCTLPHRQQQEVRALRALRMLYRTRVAAACTLHALRPGGPVSAEETVEACREQLERALCVPVHEADARRELADGGEGRLGLRACLLECALERTLRLKYGENWPEQRGSGAYLSRLWENGGAHRMEDLLQKVGFKRWSAHLLLERVAALSE